MQPLLNYHMLTFPSVSCLRPQSIENCSNRRRFRMALKWNTAKRLYLFPSSLTEVPGPQPSMSMWHSCHSVRASSLVIQNWGETPGFIFLCFISPKGCISKIPHMLCLESAFLFKSHYLVHLKKFPQQFIP